MIGKVFPSNGISIIFGESGSGKTVSTIKAINEDDIMPILLDFDDNLSQEQNQCNYTHIDGRKFIDDTSAIIPSDKVIIIDTWYQFDNYGGTFELARKIRDIGNTVIIIDHIQDLATRRDMSSMPSEYVNHCDAKLLLEKNNKSITKLHIKKCRGYRGDTPIINWMRDTIV